MSNKLKYIVAITGALLLAGCDVIAQPSDYEEPLLSNLASDLDKNIASVVYDALRDNGTLNSQAKDDIIQLIADDIFGSYEDNLASTDAEKVAFVADVEQRIYEKLYSRITSGSYETRSYFSEERFADFVRKQLYPVNETAGYISDYIFLPVSQDEIRSVVEAAIHVDYYEEFINGEIVPEIYREKLIEQYILDEDYATLGRSYARKVNYIALQTNNKHPEAAKYLLDTFIDQFILAPTATAADADLELLARAWRGLDIAPLSAEQNLLTAAGLDVSKTLNGDILAQYSKINDNVQLTDVAIENDFTSNGTYTPDEGLLIKQNALRKRDFTTDGWYIKNGGLESLPTEIRNRLFNIGVANGVDKAIDEFDASFTGADDQVSDYVRNIHGNYYLIPQNSQQVDPNVPNRDFLLYDASSSTYYIIQIEEAVNSTKLNQDEASTRNYDALYGAGTRKIIAGEVAKVLGTRDANKTSATNHYLEQYSIVFHDQDIWKYFKEVYPDIYDPKK
ncbi:MAG TPA: hypothetical protein DCX17_01810 [Firmicutes bacterium]|jgi:hypothetical protein|nr:hypothetical protein [Bacillota bacterium]